MSSLAKRAKSFPEAFSLIEAGFEYVTEMEGTTLFGKKNKLSRKAFNVLLYTFSLSLTTSAAEAARQEEMDRQSNADWDKLNDLFTRTLDDARRAYVTNYVINLIIVTIGIVLLASSLLMAWIRGLDLQTLVYAGLGIADFTALFYVSPQQRIQRLLGDFNQIQVVHRNYRMQIEKILEYNWKVYKSGNQTLSETIEVNKEVERVSINSLEAIEKYIGAAEK